MAVRRAGGVGQHARPFALQLEHKGGRRPPVGVDGGEASLAQPDVQLREDGALATTLPGASRFQLRLLALALSVQDAVHTAAADIEDGGDMFVAPSVPGRETGNVCRRPSSGRRVARRAGDPGGLVMAT